MILMMLDNCTDATYRDAFYLRWCSGAEACKKYEAGGGMLRRQGDGAGQDQRAYCHRWTVRVAERG